MSHALPDWENIIATVRCPLCECDLRGLLEPRCPECGHPIDWEELLDANLRVPPYLVESGMHGSILPFFYTQFFTTFPSRFWKRLRPTMPIDRARLYAYWINAAVLIIVPPLCVIFVPALLNPSIAPAGSHLEQIGNDVAARMTAHRELFFVTLMLAILFFAWPWITLGALLIFGSTMRRARIKREHVERCVIYSCDAGMSTSVICVVIWDLYNRGIGPRLPLGFSLTGAMTIAIASLLALGTAYRLSHAYGQYLRFPNSIVTVLVSQILAWLFALVLAGVVWMVGL